MFPGESKDYLCLEVRGVPEGWAKDLPDVMRDDRGVTHKMSRITYTALYWFANAPWMAGRPLKIDTGADYTLIRRSDWDTVEGRASIKWMREPGDSKGVLPDRSYTMNGIAGGREVYFGWVSLDLVDASALTRVTIEVIAAFEIAGTLKRNLLGTNGNTLFAMGGVCLNGHKQEFHVLLPKPTIDERTDIVTA